MENPPLDSRRREFLDVRRADCRRSYDRCAAGYDELAGSASPDQLAGLAGLIEAMSLWDELLDAGCGTGRLWPVVAESGLRFCGIDHSAGMLALARQKFPGVPTRLMALQELRAATDMIGRFGGLLCVDALQHVGPEDWPVVLDGFRRVLRPGSPAYLTVTLRYAGRGAVAPVGQVGGEFVSDDGYRYYPPRSAVERWLADARFRVADDRAGDGYWHLLARLEA